MSVTEFQRHQVLKWLEEWMGPERAAIMMDLLPPTGWGDVATKRDLDVVEERLDSRIEASEARVVGEIHRVFSEMLMKLFFGMVVSNATLVGLVFAAVRLG
ncbi:MAG: hypothetical protein U5K30_05725 [Acidimicrobiales bacterium]|nr:hypothetical protein [Acidimicrobiales bacterium]